MYIHCLITKFMCYLEIMQDGSYLSLELDSRFGKIDQIVAMDEPTDLVELFPISPPRLVLLVGISRDCSTARRLGEDL